MPAKWLKAVCSDNAPFSHMSTINTCVMAAPLTICYGNSQDEVPWLKGERMECSLPICHGKVSLP